MKLEVKQPLLWEVVSHLATSCNNVLPRLILKTDFVEGLAAETSKVNALEARRNDYLERLFK